MPGAGKEGEAKKEVDLAVEIAISTTQAILSELRLMEQDCIDDGWKRTKEVLTALSYFEERNDLVVTRIFELLIQISNRVLPDMPSDIANIILHKVQEFFPAAREGVNKGFRERISDLAITIACNLVSDSLCRFRSYQIAVCGFSILKFCYMDRFNGRNADIKKAVLEAYFDLGFSLKQVDLGPAYKLWEIYKEDLSRNNLDFVVLPNKLKEELESRWSN